MLMRHTGAILTALLHTGVDWVQENVLGQGKQDNESAVEQAKDEQISGTNAPAYYFLSLLFPLDYLDVRILCANC